MDGAAADCGAFGEAVVFLTHFRDMLDPRQRGKVTYPLDEVLLLCLLAVLAGAETIVDIARFGDKKLALLRRFRPFCDGTPSHDHLGDILATLPRVRQVAKMGQKDYGLAKRPTVCRRAIHRRPPRIRGLPQIQHICRLSRTSSTRLP